MVSFLAGGNHTNSLSDRQIRPQDVLGTHKKYVSKIEMISRDINTIEFFLFHSALKNNGGSDESKSILPSTGMPDNCHFLEGI